MNLPTFATQTVTVRRAPLTTDHGTEIRDWPNAVDHQIGGCSIQPRPRGAGEDLLGRDAVTTLMEIYLPPGADVLDTDRMLIDGGVYEVFGPVGRWQTGVLDHVLVELKQVIG